MEFELHIKLLLFHTCQHRRACSARIAQNSCIFGCGAARKVKKNYVHVRTHSKRTSSNTVMMSYLSRTPKRTCGRVEYRPCPKWQLNPRSLPLSPHFHDRKAALTVGLKVCCELAPVRARQKCGSRAHNGHKGALLNAKLRIGTPYGLVDLTDMRTRRPL